MASKRSCLAALCASILLAACDNGPPPRVIQPLPPGAETSVPVSATLPPAAPRRYEPGIGPENEEKGLKVGEIVQKSGGQKAQKEKQEQDRAAVEADLAKKRADEARQKSSDEKTSTE